MKVAVFGATGRIGRAIVNEALDRGHEVIAAQRSAVPAGATDRPGLSVVQAYVDNSDSVAAAIRGADAVVDSVGGLGHENPRISIECIGPLLSGMDKAKVRRLLVVGTAGTLNAAAGVMRMDQPGFPRQLAAEAQAHREVQAALRSLPPTGVAWTYFSPPALIEDGTRTGSVIIGLDDLLFNENGESFISNQDYAMAAIDELEQPRFIRMRFTVVSRARPGAKSEPTGAR